jgi:hypothetical protein
MFLRWLLSGTWFTNWEQYTQERATYEVEQWEAGNFPLDVWGLDMNWRNTTCGARPVDHWMRCGWQSNSTVRKAPLWCHFHVRTNDLFAATGSGQT